MRTKQEQIIIDIYSQALKIKEEEIRRLQLKILFLEKGYTIEFH